MKKRIAEVVVVVVLVAAIGFNFDYFKQFLADINAAAVELVDPSGDGSAAKKLEDDMNNMKPENWFVDETSDPTSDSTSTVSDDPTDGETTASKHSKAEIDELVDRYRIDNFMDKSASYDSSCNDEFRQLINKRVIDLIEMGKDPSVSDRVKEYNSKPAYTKDEIDRLIEARKNVAWPDSSTVMQKIVNVYDQNKKDLYSDISWLTDETKKADNPLYYYFKDGTVGGFIAKAEDAGPYSWTVRRCYENLRLDYHDTVYKKESQPIFIIRYISNENKNYVIPCSEEIYNAITDDSYKGKVDLIKNAQDRQPFTGNGYIGCKDYAIPEYTANFPNLIHFTECVIFIMDKDGNETPYAYKFKDDTQLNLY